MKYVFAYRFDLIYQDEKMLGKIEMQLKSVSNLLTLKIITSSFILKHVDKKKVQYKIIAKVVNPIIIYKVNILKFYKS